LKKKTFALHTGKREKVVLLGGKPCEGGWIHKSQHCTCHNSMWQICIGMLQNVFPLLDANLHCGHLQKQNANPTLHFKSVEDLCKTSFCQLLQPNSFLSRIQQQLLAPKRIKRHPVITHASNHMKTG
jgi:hypothetical protein